jgi:hypothetical protein
MKSRSNLKNERWKSSLNSLRPPEPVESAFICGNNMVKRAADPESAMLELRRDPVWLWSLNTLIGRGIKHVDRIVADPEVKPLADGRLQVRLE